MARVFTITPGLENMGGLKTGGQGSIYKGRRIGEIITAIKILPTPVYSENGDDKNYAVFQNEVAKLKKVNEVPNPNVVKILSSGISVAGNFPFIEMEYIEGPDLEELLHAGHSIFTITEIIKVAEQLSYALAHCHSLDVKHGDIKSNNVKYNSETGNYVLLDFGLAIMSDDQRRNSITHTGAIEFMAPEQNTGQILFQTDVYSFGVIIFELLTGTVPFKLKDKGESARNEVRLAHMASPVPNLLELRRAALPGSWYNQKKEREMQLPAWLVSLVYKCLEKKPEKRFADGEELHNYIVQQIISRPDSTAVRSNQMTVRPLLKQDFVVNQELLKKQLDQLREELIKREGELAVLKELLNEKEGRLQFIKNDRSGARKGSNSAGVSRTSFAVVLFFALALTAYAVYPIVKKNLFLNTPDDTSSYKQVKSNSKPVVGKRLNNQLKKRSEVGSKNTTEGKDSVFVQGGKPKEPLKEIRKTIQAPAEERPGKFTNESAAGLNKPAVQFNKKIDVDRKPGEPSEEINDNFNSGKNAVSKYLVVSKAYFYTEPDENSKRNEFISPLEKAVVQGLNERYGFIYVVITNPQGQVFKGWLRKSELKLYSVE